MSLKIASAVVAHVVNAEQRALVRSSDPRNPEREPEPRSDRLSLIGGDEQPTSGDILAEAGEERGLVESPR